jgi:hypothetical protein
VEQWKRDYLAVWDEHIDLLEPTPKHKIDRRAVLVKTFDELLRHALWNDNDHDHESAFPCGAGAYRRGDRDL